MKKGEYKYKESDVIEELQGMIRTLEEDKTIIFIKTLFNDKPYTSEYMSVWNRRFNRSKIIPQLIKKIKEIIESRVVEGIAHNKINVIGGIFNLKNQYGWKDKQEDINLDVKFNLVNYAGKKVKEVKAK